MALETQLATAHMTKTENRDPEATYNKMDMDELTAAAGGGCFNFTAFFQESTGRDPEALGV